MGIKKLLLLSNSQVADQPPLAYAEATIRHFLGKTVTSVVFVPYAAVRLSFDTYAHNIARRFQTMGYGLTSIHQHRHPVHAIGQAEAIVVGGGNTFQLLSILYQEHLLSPLREQVRAGTPYMGWSAGGNLACPTIKTTNDMPIVAPPSLEALNLIPFQINPHYTDDHPPGHHGETRAERIEEFLCLHPTVDVLGLREGCLLEVIDERLTLVGPQAAKLFRHGTPPVALDPGILNPYLHYSSTNPPVSA